jgi:hypothetical protein
MSLPLILKMMRTKRIVMTTTETTFAKMNMATICAFMEDASSFPEAPNGVPVNPVRHQAVCGDDGFLFFHSRYAPILCAIFFGRARVVSLTRGTCPTSKVSGRL